MFKPFKFWADYADDEHSIWSVIVPDDPGVPPPTRVKLQIFTPAIRKNLVDMTSGSDISTPPKEIPVSPLDLQKRRLSQFSPKLSPVERRLSGGSPVSSPDSLTSPSPRKTRAMSLGNFKPLISPTTPRRRRKS